jgi:hypothetical protein
MLAMLAIASSPASIAIWIIIVAALAAIVFVALKAMNVAVPPWVLNIVWIVLVAIVAVLAIKFLVGSI